MFNEFESGRNTVVCYCCCVVCSKILFEVVDEQQKALGISYPCMEKNSKLIFTLI
jgi:hypothetical protein